MPGQRASSSSRSPAASIAGSRLSRTSSHRSSPKSSIRASRGAPTPVRSVSTARPMPASTCSGWVTPASGTNATPEPKRSRSRSPTAVASRVPTRPGQRDQPRVGSPDQTGHLVDGLLPSDQRCRAHRHWTRATPGGRHLARHRHRDSRRRAGGGEPLAQQRRQVVAHQPVQLTGGAEVTVRVRRLLPDPVEQPGQARLAVGRRAFDVQQPRQPSRQLELLLQARNLHARADPPVALPVQPDEHIAFAPGTPDTHPAEGAAAPPTRTSPA